MNRNRIKACVLQLTEAELLHLSYLLEPPLWNQAWFLHWPLSGTVVSRSYRWQCIALNFLFRKKLNLFSSRWKTLIPDPNRNKIFIFPVDITAKVFLRSFSNMFVAVAISENDHSACLLKSMRTHIWCVVTCNMCALRLLPDEPPVPDATRSFIAGAP